MQFGKPLNEHDAAVFNWNKSSVWSNVPWAIEHLDDEDERVWREARRIVCDLGLTTGAEIDEYGAWSPYIITELWRRYEESQADFCARKADVKGVVKRAFEKQNLMEDFSGVEFHWLMVRKQSWLTPTRWETNKIALRLDSLVKFGELFWVVEDHDLFEALVSDIYNNPTEWFDRYKDHDGEIIYESENLQKKVEDFINNFVEVLDYCDLLDIKPYYIGYREGLFSNEEAFSILKTARQYPKMDRHSYELAKIKIVLEPDFMLIKNAFKFLKEFRAKEESIQFEDDEECAYYSCLFATYNKRALRDLSRIEIGELSACERSEREHHHFAFLLNLAFDQWCFAHNVECGRCF